MKKNISIILSIIALVGVISVWMLWFFSVIDFAIVSTDTFISTMVGILGLLITFVVGWQIVNVLEIKDRMQKVTQLEKQLELLKDSTILLHHNMQSQISLSRGEMWEKEQEYDSAFAAYNVALRDAILSKSQNIKYYINQLDRILQHIRVVGKSQLEMITRDADIIYKSDAYLQFFKQDYDNMIHCITSKPIRNE